MSRTETLGRLYAAGFEIVDKNLLVATFILSLKRKKPLLNHERHYGPIFKMRRHGKNREM